MTVAGYEDGDEERAPADFDNERQDSRRKKGHKRRRKEEMEDLRRVMDTPEGLRVIERIMEETKLLAPNLFTGNSGTFYNIGKRDLGLWLYHEVMEAAPASFIKMLQLKLPMKETKDG